jgi:hypothetical protein
MAMAIESVAAFAEKKEHQYGPAPAGFFLTSKVIDEVPGLCAAPLAARIRQILVSAETGLFMPLLSSGAANDFPQAFTLFAARYFPVRLQALCLILNEVDPKTFRIDYFSRAPQIAMKLALHADRWGLGVEEVVTSFGQYFESALKIVKVSHRLNHAPVNDLLRLATSMTEIDYGFTAMGLVFEGSVRAPEAWRVSEVFRLTRRSLLEYEDATNNLIAYLDQENPDQTEMFSQQVPTRLEPVVALRPRSLGQAGRHLRNISSPVKWPIDDVDSDYE